jgi:hypothetical protein
MTTEDREQRAAYAARSRVQTLNYMVRHAQPYHEIYCGMVDWVISFDPVSRLYYMEPHWTHCKISMHKR